MLTRFSQKVDLHQPMSKSVQHGKSCTWNSFEPASMKLPDFSYAINSIAATDQLIQGMYRAAQCDSSSLKYMFIQL